MGCSLCSSQDHPYTHAASPKHKQRAHGYNNVLPDCIGRDNSEGTLEAEIKKLADEIETQSNTLYELVNVLNDRVRCLARKVKSLIEAWPQRNPLHPKLSAFHLKKNTENYESFASRTHLHAYAMSVKAQLESLRGFLDNELSLIKARHSQRFATLHRRIRALENEIVEKRQRHETDRAPSEVPLSTADISPIKIEAEMLF